MYISLWSLCLDLVISPWTLKIIQKIIGAFFFFLRERRRFLRNCFQKHHGNTQREKNEIYISILIPIPH